MKLTIFAASGGARDRGHAHCYGRTSVLRKGENMDTNHTVSPHILRRPLGDDKEVVATVPSEGARALLVFGDSTGAESFGVDVGYEGFEAVSVSPEEISEVCANHGIGLVALYEILEPQDLSVLPVQVIEDIFEEAPR